MKLTSTFFSLNQLTEPYCSLNDNTARKKEKFESDLEEEREMTGSYGSSE